MLLNSNLSNFSLRLLFPVNLRNLCQSKWSRWYFNSLICWQRIRGLSEFYNCVISSQGVFLKQCSSGHCCFHHRPLHGRVWIIQTVPSLQSSWLFGASEVHSSSPVHSWGLRFRNNTDYNSNGIWIEASSSFVFVQWITFASILNLTPRLNIETVPLCPLFRVPKYLINFNEQQDFTFLFFSLGEK